MIQRTLIRHGEAVVLIAIGGILGSNLRHAVGVVSGDALVVTLVVNAAGSLGLGLLLFDARADELLSKRLRYVFGTGLFASFTTYSTFVADAAMASPEIGGLYIGASYAAGFAGILGSRKIVEWHANTAPIGPRSGSD